MSRAGLLDDNLNHNEMFLDVVIGKNQITAKALGEYQKLIDKLDKGIKSTNFNVYKVKEEAKPMQNTKVCEVKKQAKEKPIVKEKVKKQVKLKETIKIKEQLKPMQNIEFLADEFIEVNTLLTVYKFNHAQSYLETTKKLFKGLIFWVNGLRVVNVADVPKFDRLIYEVMQG